MAAGSLIAGFAVAQATGIRPIGGLVLAAGAGWCFLRWRSEAGQVRAIVLLGAYLAAFVASHLLAGVLRPWGAVLTVAAALALASAGLTDHAPRGTIAPSGEVDAGNLGRPGR